MHPEWLQPQIRLATPVSGVTPGSLSIDSVPDLSFTSNVANIASTTVNLNDAGDIHTTYDQGEGTNTNWTLSAMPVAGT